MNRVYWVLAIIVLLFLAPKISAQATHTGQHFEKIKMLVPDADKVRQIAVRVRFEKDSLVIESAKDKQILKRMSYTDLKSAEYSYTKNPRWKTGLGLGATSILFPPLFLVAVPLGFTKHRRHRLTIRGEKDYAVLKLVKSQRKVFMPAFETQSGVKIEALGESK